ncbi:MAG: diadenylate cyclase CdaA [Myxococcota bacterium]
MEAGARYLEDFWSFVATHFDPARDLVDIAIVTFAIYWLLLLIRGTRAVQILVGLVVLIGLSLASEFFQFATVGLILENFLGSAVLIFIVLFQHDIRRALARVGRGFFPSASAEQQFEIAEDVVRAAQAISQKRAGALIVLERETSLSDQVESATPVDAVVSGELLISLFLPGGPLHDGAVILQHGRVAAAGAILPLSRTFELAEGLGTRHRAAVGITEETDAIAVAVSEETGAVSVALAGDLLRGLDAPQLRALLRQILSGERRELPPSVDLLHAVQAGGPEASPGPRSAGAGA